MAHTDPHKGNKPMPANPKPEDDVQLHIETVIPDTEKEAPQPNPANTETTKHLKDREQVPDKKATDHTPAGNTAAEPEEQAKEVNEANESTDTNTSGKRDDDGDDDVRDQIETVST